MGFHYKPNGIFSPLGILIFKLNRNYCLIDQRKVYQLSGKNWDHKGNQENHYPGNGIVFMM